METRQTIAHFSVKILLLTKIYILAKLKKKLVENFGKSHFIKLVQSCLIRQDCRPLLESCTAKNIRKNPFTTDLIAFPFVYTITLYENSKVETRSFWTCNLH